MNELTQIDTDRYVQADDLWYKDAIIYQCM